MRVHGKLFTFQLEHIADRPFKFRMRKLEGMSMRHETQHTGLKAFEQMG